MLVLIALAPANSQLCKLFNKSELWCLQSAWEYPSDEVLQEVQLIPQPSPMDAGQC